MVLIKSPKHNYKKNGTTKKSIHCDTELKEKKQIYKKKVILLIILIVLSITITIITIINYNQFHNNTSTMQNKELLPQEKYEKAMSLLKDDEKSAIELLREIPDFKDAKTYIDNYDFKHRFDGTYSDKNSTLSFERRYIVDGEPTKIISYQYFNSEKIIGDEKYSVGYFNAFENTLNCNDDYTICTSDDENYSSTYNFYDDKIILKRHNKNPASWELDYVDVEETYYKISNSIELPKERETLDGKPKIGMTTEEVLNSTWGKPKKINKDTYSWGVKEQWVYDNGYIYFKNGIVTSISER